MTKRFFQLLEEMTPEEQAEVEYFAAFVIARRKLGKLRILTDDIPAEELMRLVEDSGSFNWLNAEEEDVYSMDDGETAEWPSES